MRFACRDHRTLIWFDRDGNRPSSLAGTVEKAEDTALQVQPPSARSPSQGRLL
jgi:hypothetical protein